MAASFGSLPLELILDIAEHTSSQHPYQLSALARCNRKCYEFLFPVLLERFSWEARRWAVRVGNLKVLEGAMAKFKLVDKQFESGPLHCKRPGSTDPNFRDLLHIAALHGHNEIILYLLGLGADVSASITYRACNCLPFSEQWRQNERRPGAPGDHPLTPWYRWRPLHFAICGGHMSTAILLLQNKAPYRVADGPGCHFCSNCAAKVYPIWLNFNFDNSEISVLDCAAANGLIPVLKWIREHMAQDAWFRRAPFRSPNAMNALALYNDFEAVRSGIQELRAITDAESEGDDRNGRDQVCDMALVFACFFGNFSAARAFLSCAYPVASPSTILLRRDALGFGLSPRLWSFDQQASYGRCLQLVLNADYDNWTSKRQSRRQWQQERRELISALVKLGGCKLGVDLEAPGPTPLCVAAERGLCAEIELLIELGAPLNDGGSCGPPLIKAVQSLHVGAVEILLTAGASLLPDSVAHGKVPMAVAQLWANPTDTPEMAQRRRDILVLLVKRGVFIGPHDDSSPNPLCSVIFQAMVAFRNIDKEWWEGLLSDILKHPTEYNITKSNWESMLPSTLAPEYKWFFKPKVSKELVMFGMRLGFFAFNEEDRGLGNTTLREIIQEHDTEVLHGHCSVLCRILKKNNKAFDYDALVAVFRRSLGQCPHLSLRSSSHEEFRETMARLILSKSLRRP
ncbi:ankyrin repeat-containing domain protein [Cercophora newfieldiana]|uniref:Ankyrin repeat-containing domain protein n=1 Tax=Cercophora newfieldiana TaxID=92897 RepID=A0AA40CNI1_9PEZI|nr:ankyrin repeat-containing domain protein [Cercophora newfieldiana]